jgi:hypothetical protein
MIADLGADGLQVRQIFRVGILGPGRLHLTIGNDRPIVVSIRFSGLARPVLQPISKFWHDPCISLNSDLPLRWRFYFYKSQGAWKLVDLRVDDGLVELFEEAGRARK